MPLSEGNCATTAEEGKEMGPPPRNETWKEEPNEPGPEEHQTRAGPEKTCTSAEHLEEPRNQKEEETNSAPSPHQRMPLKPTAYVTEGSRTHEQGTRTPDDSERNEPHPTKQPKP